MVERLDVEFRSEGVACRAWLYTADGAGPRPTVVLAGGWCYVREVVMPTHAAAFAAAGLNALVFDYRNLGVSDGDNRQHPHTTHMTLYSDKSKVDAAAKIATRWFVETL